MLSVLSMFYVTFFCRESCYPIFFAILLCFIYILQNLPSTFHVTEIYSWGFHFSFCYYMLCFFGIWQAICHTCATYLSLQDCLKGSHTVTFLAFGLCLLQIQNSYPVICLPQSVGYNSCNTCWSSSLLLSQYKVFFILI